MSNLIQQLNDKLNHKTPFINIQVMPTENKSLLKIKRINYKPIKNIENNQLTLYLKLNNQTNLNNSRLIQTKYDYYQDFMMRHIRDAYNQFLNIEYFEHNHINYNNIDFKQLNCQHEINFIDELIKTIETFYLKNIQSYDKLDSQIIKFEHKMEQQSSN